MSACAVDECSHINRLDVGGWVRCMDCKETLVEPAREVPDLQAGIERVLAGHMRVSIVWSLNGLEVQCTCGDLLDVVNPRGRFPIEPSAEDRATWCAHVAARVVEYIRQEGSDARDEFQNPEDREHGEEHAGNKEVVSSHDTHNTPGGTE